MLLLLLGPLWGQESYNSRRIDSLQTLLAGNKTLNETKVDLLNQLGYEYWIVDPSQSEEFGIQALEIAKILPYPAGQAFANRVIGVAHWARGNSELSFQFLLAAEEAYGELGDSLGMANTTLNLGMAYADQRNFSLAEKKYANALAVFNRLGAESRIATAYTKMADLLIVQKNYEPAFHHLRRALDIHQKANFLYGIAEVNSKLGKLATAKEDYNDAISYFLLAVEAGGRRNDHVGLAEYFHGIGNAYLQKKDYSQADEYLAQAKKIAEGFGLQKIRRDVYGTYKDLESQRGNYRLAIDYYDQYLGVRDALYNQEKSNIIANMEARRAYEEKEEELTLAQKNLDLLVQSNKVNRLTKIMLLLGLLVLGTLAWGLIQRKNRVLEEKQRKLTAAKLEASELQVAIKGKEQELTSYTLNFVQKNELISDLKASIESLKKSVGETNRSKLNTLSRKVDSILRVDEDWADFRKHFESVHPNLMLQLNEEFPDLTKNEFRLIALIRLNLSSKEISSVLGISPDSVKTARYRLRKKLRLENQDNLFEFLVTYA